PSAQSCPTNRQHHRVRSITSGCLTSSSSSSFSEAHSPSPLVTGASMPARLRHRRAIATAAAAAAGSHSGSGSSISHVILRRKPLLKMPRPRSCTLSDNGSAGSPLFTSVARKSIDDYPNGRGLRLMHRTMSLSIEGRATQRTQSMSESPSATSNPGILAGYDVHVQHSSTSNFFH
uniref:MAST3 n=1 Tax=Macrostomum lignano TaxID=282301 RepID=A0A1I8GP74_9PLAT